MDRLAHLGRVVSVAGAARVAIVGGGYAGMATAVALAESGIPTTVFEAGKELGGRARRIDYRGEVLDNGQHILSGAYSALLRMMALTGVPETASTRIPLRLSLRPEFTLQAPRWIAPLHLAWALLTARGLTLPERYAAIAFMQSMKACRFQVDPGQTVSLLLAAHHQPEKLSRYLWEPLTISALNTPVNVASAQVFASVLRDALAGKRECSDLILPRADLSALFPDAAARWLAAKGSNVRAGVKIKSVNATTATQHNESKFNIETSDGETLPFDAVVLAIGPHQFDSMSLPQALNPAIHFQYEPIVTVYLKFTTAVNLPETMFGQTGGIAQWFFDRRQLSEQAGGGENRGALIAAVISASGAHEEMTHEVLASTVLAELARHTGLLPPLEWHKVITEKFATFACTPELHRRRPPALTATPGLFLAGDYVAGDYPATLEGAVRSGVNAARLVASHLSKTATA
ncbi:MAG: hydroxysqualene dehydroxylase HpnE [Betaproteobacteria bacterium]